MKNEKDKIRFMTRWIEGEATGRWGIIALVVIVLIVTKAVFS